MLENQSQEQAQPAPEGVEELNENDLEDVSGGIIVVGGKATHKDVNSKLARGNLHSIPGNPVFPPPQQRPPRSSH